MSDDYPFSSYQSGQNPNAQPFDPNAFYSDVTVLNEAQPSHDWYEVSCVRAGAPNVDTIDAVRALAFDPRKELVWVAAASGMLHSHLANDMSRVVSTYITEPSNDVSVTPDVRDIVVSSSAVLAAVSYGLAIVNRGGAIHDTVRADAVKNAKALALNPLSDSHVCIGGDSPMLAVIDVESTRILRQATLRGATGVTAACWSAPNAASNLAIFSTATGRISMCDPSTMREINAIVAFSGSVSSISTSGYYVAATGFASRGGVSYLEHHVKLFDIRAVDNPLPFVVFPAPPHCVIFDAHSAEVYNSNLAMWVLAPSGLLQLLDVSTMTSAQPPLPLCDQIQLDAGSDILTTMAVSSQGLLTLGDSGGFVHQWTSSDTAKVNQNSEPLWDAPIQTHPPPPSIQVNELLTSDLGITIPKFAIPDLDNGYLTDEMFESPEDVLKSRGNQRLQSMRGVNEQDSHRDFFPRVPFGRFPLVVSDDIVQRAQRTQSTVAFTQAPPSFVRNSESGHKKFPSVRHLKKKSKSPFQNRSNVRSDRTGGGESSRRRARKVDLSNPVEKSMYVRMDLVAWESIEGFDFLQYNQSGLFCGLENALPNVYVNAAVQVLYFSPPIRKAIGDHSCDRDWCISCELGFLFHMFDLGGAGMACEAGNFTRAFMTMANAGALGLLDGPLALPLSQRIENFTRYLLEQLHKDDEHKSESAVSQIFGADTLSHGTFLNSGTKWERDSNPFQHTLSYEGVKGKDGETGESFCLLLKRSLSQSLDPTRAFCEASQQFETMTHRRELRSLPNVMLLGCNSKARGYLEWWLGEEGGNIERAKNTNLQTHVTSKGTSSLTLDKIVAKAMEKEKKLVESIRIDISEDIVVSEIENDDEIYGYDENDDEPSNDSGDKVADYDLSFVIMHVKPNPDDENVDDVRNGSKLEGHLVAYIRVPFVYRQKREQNDTSGSVNGKGEWWCFNDFVISKIMTFDEVAAVDVNWKMPCLVGYVRRDLRQRVESDWWGSKHDGIDVREVISDENRNAAIGLQVDEEPPEKGSLLALDCEFVMVSREEADIFPDGTREIVVPARKALARVSVVRGYGRLEGRALIDDYVAVREPVVDYLTRFSGLVEGDLHAGRTRYTLSSLKTVYKRLRCLVDAGCVFVGHGLKSDFRIINFVVPAEQVIDTVTIFRQPNKRLLGLRFLSHALLGDDIQSETHDSIEDSNAALRLYQLYARLKGKSANADRFTYLLKELYAYGYLHNWKVEEDEPFVIDWDAVPSNR